MLHVLAIAGVQLDVHALALISGFVVPLVVGLITKMNAHKAIKAVSLAVLSALAGVLALALKDNGHIDLWVAIDTLSTAFIGAVSSYYGFWKPSGIAPAIAASTPDVGLGSNDPTSPYSDTTKLIVRSSGTTNTATPMAEAEHFKQTDGNA